MVESLKNIVGEKMLRLAWLIPYVFAVPVIAADWPQWRGPEGQGHAPTAVDLPVQWSVGSVEGISTNRGNICWRTELPGRAWSLRHDRW